jgi:hypothetical protein
MSFPDSSSGWAVASSGEILRYTPSVLTDTPPPDIALPSAYALEQNYPNPFNGSTIIRFGLPAETSVRLELFDVLGRSVRVLTNATWGAGSHELTLNAQDLSSGVYFYRLEARPAAAAAGFTVARRLVLIR